MGYVWCEICVGYVWCEICVGYVWREICVGYVWCEIRQQSSEEPCDETSFGKKRDLSGGNRYNEEGSGHNRYTAKEAVATQPLQKCSGQNRFKNAAVDELKPFGL